MGSYKRVVVLGSPSHFKTNIISGLLGRDNQTEPELGARYWKNNNDDIGIWEISGKMGLGQQPFESKIEDLCLGANWIILLIDQMKYKEEIMNWLDTTRFHANAIVVVDEKENTDLKNEAHALASDYNMQFRTCFNTPDSINVFLGEMLSSPLLNIIDSSTHKRDEDRNVANLFALLKDFQACSLADQKYFIAYVSKSVEAVVTNDRETTITWREQEPLVSRLEDQDQDVENRTEKTYNLRNRQRPSAGQKESKKGNAPQKGRTRGKTPTKNPTLELTGNEKEFDETPGKNPGAESTHENRGVPSPCPTLGVQETWKTPWKNPGGEPTHENLDIPSPRPTLGVQETHKTPPPVPPVQETQTKTRVPELTRQKKVTRKQKIKLFADELELIRSQSKRRGAQSKRRELLELIDVSVRAFTPYFPPKKNENTTARKTTRRPPCKIKVAVALATNKSKAKRKSKNEIDSEDNLEIVGEQRDNVQSPVSYEEFLEKNKNEIERHSVPRRCRSKFPTYCDPFAIDCPLKFGETVSKEIEMFVDDHLSSGSSSEEWVYNRGSSYISYQDFRDFYGKGFTAGEIINSVLHNLKRDANLTSIKWMYIPSELLTLQEVLFRDAKAIKSLPHIFTEELEKSEHLFVVIHQPDHWFLMDVKILQKQIIFYNSTKSDGTYKEARDGAAKKVKEFLSWRLSNKSWMDVKHDWALKDTYSLQANGVDCGVFVLKYIVCILKGWNMQFGTDCSNDRKLLSYNLLYDFENSCRRDFVPHKKNQDTPDFEIEEDL